MGTINYKTSDYITVGYDLSCDFDGETFDEQDEEKQLDIEFMYSIVTYILEKYDFWYYHLSIKNGYYEGFSIDIENNFSIAYDDCYCKREAQKEITQLKKFLLECIENGLCVVHPGWCTAYLSYRDSINEINDAIKEMRIEAKNIPTWNQYERSTK